ncbi:hypothetical protein BJV82DRAFT_617376 [Fennellomyces sp. T-0311]|nr:hypothetical protein BJV82DRAFT_617376 [Fennellomyces sp. T-0311]
MTTKRMFCQCMNASLWLISQTLSLNWWPRNRISGRSSRTSTTKTTPSILEQMCFTHYSPVLTRFHLPAPRGKSPANERRACQRGAMTFSVPFSTYRR